MFRRQASGVRGRRFILYLNNDAGDVVAKSFGLFGGRQALQGVGAVGEQNRKVIRRQVPILVD
jgi:hypothetical protein